jgi:hypothetical protein
MTTLVLPTRQDVPFYDFSIPLDGVTFRLEFHWNDRDSAWYFAIFDAVDEPLLSGRKVVLGIPLINRFRDPRLPAGDITAIDTTGMNTEPGLTDLGTRVHLLYTELTDIPAEWLSS